MIESMSSMLMRARHMQIMEIYHSEFYQGDVATENAVTILNLMTTILERQLKLEPEDHIGKKVIIIDPEFEEYIDAIITWQELTPVDQDGWQQQRFTLYYQNSETGGFTREQFRFVGGD